MHPTATLQRMKMQCCIHVSVYLLLAWPFSGFVVC